MSATQKTTVLYFGAFELDLEAGKLLKNGRMVPLRPQPFRLLSLLVAQPGRLVTREEIQSALWKDDMFVDFEQGVNFAVKQVREDRKSTRLNSSHSQISYAVFCLKKKSVVVRVLRTDRQP